MPKISVIMNCAYGVKYLREAIDSVFAQSFDDWQIVFIDNVSDDGSAEVAREYEKTGRLKYVRLETRIPLYAARNVGIDHADGEFVTFLDVDDLYVAGTLDALMSRMTPEVSFVYGGWSFMDAQAQDMGREVQGRVRGNLVNALLWRSFVSVSSILLRRPILDRLQFDPHYDLLGDFDLWIRLSADGHRCDFVEGNFCRIRIHGANLSVLKRRKWIEEERRFYRGFLRNHGLLRYPMIAAYILKRELGSLLQRGKM